MIQLLLLHEEDSVFQFLLLFPLTPPRTLCAAGSDAPSSLPCRPESSPGPGSGTCSSSSSPHTWTQRRRRRLVRPAAPRGWTGEAEDGEEEKKEGWRWGEEAWRAAAGSEGAGGRASGRGEGRRVLSAPERSTLQGCAARTSASAGAGGASRSPSLSLRPGGRRRSAAWAAEG